MLSACACRQMQLIHTFDAAHLEICLGVWGFWWKRQWCPPLSLCSINSCRWKQPHTSSTSSSELNFIINTPNQQLLCLGYVLLLPHHKNLSVRLQKKKKTAVVISWWRGLALAARFSVVVLFFFCSFLARLYSTVQKLYSNFRLLQYCTCPVMSWCLSLLLYAIMHRKL